MRLRTCEKKSDSYQLPTFLASAAPLQKLASTSGQGANVWNHHPAMVWFRSLHFPIVFFSTNPFDPLLKVRVFRWWCFSQASWVAKTSRIFKLPWVAKPYTRHPRKTSHETPKSGGLKKDVPFQRRVIFRFQPSVFEVYLGWYQNKWHETALIIRVVIEGKSCAGLDLYMVAVQVLGCPQKLSTWFANWWFHPICKICPVKLEVGIEKNKNTYLNAAHLHLVCGFLRTAI